jgi:hypothetical protein
LRVSGPVARCWFWCVCLWWFQHGAVVVQQKMYVFGGNHNGRYLGDIQVVWSSCSAVDCAFRCCIMGRCLTVWNPCE